MWKLSFLAAVWSIWKERNKRSCEGKVANVNTIAEGIKSLVVAWVSVLLQFKSILVNIISQMWKKWVSLDPSRCDFL